MDKRVDSIDVFRGFAVLLMIFWQIFDFFSKKNIYTDQPYYLPFFNMPFHAASIGLFAFISGASVYISVRKRLNEKVGVGRTFIHLARSYGSYILISLFFTSFVFGFKTFYNWNEALQGIGLAAMIAAVLLLLLKSKWLLLVIGASIIFIQPLLREVVGFHSVPVSADPLTLFANLSVRGIFSLSNVLPPVLFGIVLSMFVFKLKKKQLIMFSLAAGAVIVLASLLMHFLNYDINYYGRSPAYLIFIVGVCFLIFGLIEFSLLTFKKNRVFGLFILFGKTALVAYLFHFLFIYKPLELLGLESMFASLPSYALSLFSIVVIYYFCKLWLKKSGVINKIRLLTKIS